MNKILAKSDGTTLIQHSKDVSRVAVEIARQSLIHQDDDILKVIRIGGLLHDVGKCLDSFQLKIKKFKDTDSIEHKLPYRHNEIGWAFLVNHLKLKSNLLEPILDVVYWHHGISNKMSSYSNLDVNILDNDVIKMVTFVEEVLGKEYIEYNDKDISAPIYYHGKPYINNGIDDLKDKNAKNTFIRACIVSADRLVSSLPGIKFTDEDIKDIISKTKKRYSNIDINNHIYFGNERFKLQSNILKDIDRTTVIKAPAGFGKTLLGLLWSFNRNNKLIWVCPRNVVASSVYKSITTELENFGVNNISVELFLGNEVKEYNKYFKEEPFSSDIVVTNIDNYLAPSVDNRSANRLRSIVDNDVIFDEYHELIGDSALYACFMNIMMVRHMYTNSETLLLSATPTKLHEEWNSKDKRVKVLPNNDEHYPAPHKSKYKINVLKSFNDIESGRDQLFIYNTITNAQRNYDKLKGKLLFHSNFTETDKDVLLANIYEQYGKKSKRKSGKSNIVGTHVIQASLDISVANLYESILSPESTLQRIGRCNRWGDYDITPTINLVNNSDIGENKIKEILYTKNLSNMWFEFISKLDGKEVTLDELYQLYNKFGKENEAVLKKYLRTKYSDSLRMLSDIHPVKYNNIKPKNTDIKTSGGNKLRSTGLDTFVTCKMYRSKEYCEPFSHPIYSNYTKEFDEKGNVLNKMKSAMRAIRNMGDDKFDYNEILNDKRITLDKVRLMGKKSNTPYIIFNKVYHKKYGLIREIDLTNILNK